MMKASNLLDGSLLGAIVRLALAVVLALMWRPSAAVAQGCVGSPIAIQILGSGGPFVNADRASSSYLVWSGEQARVLVDAGGGAFFRFGQARAKLSDLSLLAISHLHPDHVSDLPALLWLSDVARQETLPISGPSGNDVAPGFATFLGQLFNEKTGAFPMLGATLGGAGRGVRLDIGVVDVAKREPSIVLDRPGIRVTAVNIPHGNVPALAYRVQFGAQAIVFSTDQNGTDPRFIEFARGANVLVMHLAIAVGANNPLHAAPDVVGRVAQEARVGRLVLSHIGQFDLDAAVAEVKKHYTGPLTVGVDMQCTPVP